MLDKEKIIQTKKKYYEEHREQWKKYKKKRQLEHPEEIKKYNRKYYMEHIEYYKKNNEKYRQENKEEKKQYDKQYHKANRQQLLNYNKQWKINHPEKMKEMNVRQTSKRRLLGFLPLNRPFKDSEAHHINRNDIIYIPKELHQSISHSIKTGRNMEEINRLAMNFIKEKKKAE